MIFEIDTTRKRETIDITERVRQIVRSAKPKLERGLCHVMVLHATAAIVVNENDDPNIGVDLLTALGRMVPEHEGWLHDRIDDNAQAHILASMLGPSEIVPVENGDLRLGRWQGLMLVELDGPRRGRRVLVTLTPAAVE
jgi:secondary thiamine-phosphate synthase enzyme